MIDHHTGGRKIRARAEEAKLHPSIRRDDAWFSARFTRKIFHGGTGQGGAHCRGRKSPPSTPLAPVPLRPPDPEPYPETPSPLFPNTAAPTAAPAAAPHATSVIGTAVTAAPPTTIPPPGPSSPSPSPPLSPCCRPEGPKPPKAPQLWGAIIL